MSDQPHPSPSLSEISHLFLSGVRDRQTGGGPRPQRRPPQPAASGVELTPEEVAHVLGEQHATPAPRRRRATPPLAAVLAAHLNGKQQEQVCAYARHLAAGGRRVGLIELDACEFRLTRFDADTDAAPDTPAVENYEPRRMAEAIEEMSADVDQWLINLPSPRLPEARALLRHVEHWVLLCTCDHDGVVACYRTVKGLVETHRPRLSLAVVEAHSESESAAVFGKLAGVCRQFLEWSLEPEPMVRPAPDVRPHVVLCCRPTRDKGQIASAPQWQVVTDFLAKLKLGADADVDMEPAMPNSAPAADHPHETRRHVADLVVDPQLAVAPHSEPVAPPAATPERVAANDDSAEVLDLGESAPEPAAILAAVLGRGAQLVECPLRPPVCPDSRLAVSRDGRLVLLALARQGLTELRTIGQAYRWLIENRSLIGMALPQLAIDAPSMPHLRLLIDHADATAELLQPMLQSGNVTVQTYRKLRWGQKTGLLLEAA